MRIIVVKSARPLLAILMLGSGLLWAHMGAQTERDLLDHLIEKTPGEQLLYIKRGESWARDGEYAMALADFDQAALLGDPGYLLFPRGQTYYRMSEFERAQGCFDRILAVNPEDAAALSYRARILRDAGRWEAAITDFEALFRLQPKSEPGYYLSAAQLSLKVPGRGVSGALEIVDLGIANLGVLVSLQDYAIALETQRGEYSAALVRLESLRPQLGKSPSWQVEKGRLLAAMGREQESQDVFTQAQQQLSTLRPTPARIALQGVISTLLQY
jgi:tetratricopeptide (TPR) repeat protein